MKKYNFDFKIQSASLVLDSDYSLGEVAKASNVNRSAIRTWVKQLKEERKGITTEGPRAITDQHQQTQVLALRCPAYFLAPRAV